MGIGVPSFPSLCGMNPNLHFLGFSLLFVSQFRDLQVRAVGHWGPLCGVFAVCAADLLGWATFLANEL